MDWSRRDWMKLVSAGGAAAAATTAADAGPRVRALDGWVKGHMTGAEALVEALIQEGTDCVYGIPGAQQNELWDTFKSKHLDYLLVTHEYSAACMADGYARSTGKPGVLAIVPGPGLTNALTGLGESLLDSIPIVCIVGDVSNACNAHAFQVHCLDQVALLKPVTKEVLTVRAVDQIPGAIRAAMSLARSGEPGPVGVVIPYNLLIEAHRYNVGPVAEAALPCDDVAVQSALRTLGDRRLRVGIYAGLGCMDHSAGLVRLAETLQAPVATSMSGKGAFPENHPLSVGWGYGPQGTRVAEKLFQHVDLVLALGVKYSEVSTGFYSQPQTRHLIHVDINKDNLGRNMRTTACVHSDVGVFLQHAIDDAANICRPTDRRITEQIAFWKREEARFNLTSFSSKCIDPMNFILALRRACRADALAFVDVTVSQYWATEVFQACQPRTFFNPTDNQSMGWSIPAAIGAQRVHPGRQVVTITGDGCFLMSAMEISTANRAGLPVKFFVLDDQAYHYMQELQKPAYQRTTATMLAPIDYRALAQAFGVGYQEIGAADELDVKVRCALDQAGPVLTRVIVDYGNRPIRWLRAARDRYVDNLTVDQKARFLARVGRRSLTLHKEND